jgi:hypothetical protein
MWVMVLSGLVLALALLLKWRGLGTRPMDVQYFGENSAKIPQALVQVDDDVVSCLSPGGRCETVWWNDLIRVLVVTTDQGPFVDDIFWVLQGQNGQCVVPSESQGVDALFDRLKKLPGFNWDAAIDASSSVENREFLCWEREKQGPVAESPCR